MDLRSRSWTWRSLTAAILFATILGLLPGPALADPLDDETRRIAKLLQCPICESVSVADSTSELAAQMRAVIRKKLESGESEEQIIAYFVERYGEGVRTEPSRAGFSMLAWLAPALGLSAGLAVLALVLRAWLAPPARRPAGELQASFGRNGLASGGGSGPGQRYVDRARRELESYGSGD